MNVIRGGEGGFVLVPGLEPTSVLTSTRMTAEMQEAGLLGCSIVSVRDLLEAIPGSRIEHIYNNGRMGMQRVLILPGYDIDCPCELWPDYYGTMRELCREPTEEELDAVQASCDAFAVNLCEDRPQWRGQ